MGQMSQKGAKGTRTASQAFGRNFAQTAHPRGQWVRVGESKRTGHTQRFQERILSLRSPTSAELCQAWPPKGRAEEEGPPRLAEMA